MSKPFVSSSPATPDAIAALDRVLRLVGLGALSPKNNVVTVNTSVVVSSKAKGKTAKRAPRKGKQ